MRGGWGEEVNPQVSRAGRAAGSRHRRRRDVSHLGRLLLHVSVGERSVSIEANAGEAVGEVGARATILLHEEHLRLLLHPNDHVRMAGRQGVGVSTSAREVQKPNGGGHLDATRQVDARHIGKRRLVEHAEGVAAKLGPVVGALLGQLSHRRNDGSNNIVGGDGAEAGDWAGISTGSICATNCASGCAAGGASVAAKSEERSVRRHASSLRPGRRASASAAEASSRMEARPLAAGRRTARACVSQGSAAAGGARGVALRPCALAAASARSAARIRAG
eukprot:scaffold131770_cov28-Tisochrysis_lutea.AAC.2